MRKLLATAAVLIALSSTAAFAGARTPCKSSQINGKWTMFIEYSLEFQVTRCDFTIRKRQVVHGGSCRFHEALRADIEPASFIRVNPFTCAVTGRLYPERRVEGQMSLDGLTAHGGIYEFIPGSEPGEIAGPGEYSYKFSMVKRP